MTNPSIVNGANGKPVVQTVAGESKKELLKSKPSMVEKNAKEKLNKTAMRNPVLLIVNGANGEPVAQIVAMETKKERLKSKPSMVGKNVKVKLKETAMKDHVVEQFL